MSNAILSCKDVSINFGGVKAVQNVTLDIEKGSITSIIGPNGAGKTTFFNIISGVYKPTSGKVLFDGEDITNLKQHQVSRLGMARTFQNIRLFVQLDNVRNVHLPTERHDFGENKRMAVYDFFGDVFKLDTTMKDEKKIVLETKDEFYVY